MRTFLLLFSFLFYFGSANAQMPDGANAPMWTLADFQTGVNYSLQDYVDQGIPVILDFSATWCPPCWSYHQTHILADIYDEYGPTGTVQTDGAMVFFMEGDYGTNDACLLGNSAACSGSTMGDWTNGTPYPIFNIPASTGLTAAYQISYWPTIYAVSPQGTVYEVGQASKSTWESWLFETFALEIDNAQVAEILCPEEGGSIDLTVSGGSGNLSYQWSNGANTQDISGLASGTYSVVITEGRGYSITQTFEVTNGPEPLEIVMDGQNVACNGNGDGIANATVEGGVGPYTYLWSTGETTPMIQGLSGGVYSVEILDGNDCFISSAIEVVEPEVLNQNTTQFPTYCGEDNGQVLINAFGGTTPYIYTLDGQTSSNNLFPNVASGGYIASVEDANGCFVQFSVFVEEIEAPEAVATATAQPSCDNPQVELSGEGTTTGNVIYEWYSDDGGVIVSGQGTLNPIVEGNGTYNLLVTDQNYNCTDIASVVIEADTEIPTSDAGAPQTITCDVLEVVLDGSLSSTGDNYSYEWSTSDGNIIDGENSISATVNAAGEYLLLVTNTNNGCTSTATVSVDQTAELPNADAGSASPITCEVSTVVLDGSASDSGDEITYTWTTEDGSIVSGENTTSPEVDAPGSYLLEVYNSVSGCVSYSTVVVGENTTSPEGEIAEVEMLTCVLEQQALVLTVDAADVSYDWTTVDGNIVEGEDSSMPLIDAPGTYTVSYTDLATGCVGTQEVTISEFINTPESQFSFSATQAMFEFTNESSGNPSTFEWNFGDGNTSTEENPTHEYLENGAYNICLKITNECGESETCSSVTIVIGADITFNSTLNSPTCNASCDGVLEITPAGALEEITTIVSGPDGFVAEDEYDLSGLCAGVYTIEITNQIGETNTESVEISEPDAIQVDESEVVHVDCAGNANGQITIDISGGTGMLTTMWDNEEEGQVIGGLSGGEFEATIVDEQGCTETVTFVVEEPTEIDVDVDDITNIDDDNPTGAIDITVTGGVEPYDFLWSHGDQAEDVDGLDIGEYTVIVTDANGCQDTYGPYEVKNLVGITEIQSLTRFNISPNPTSDEFVLELEFNSKTDVNVSIMNHLGQVLKTENISNSSLSKTYNVSELPSGIYLVRIQVGNEMSIRKIVKQ